MLVKEPRTCFRVSIWRRVYDSNRGPTTKYNARHSHQNPNIITIPTNFLTYDTLLLATEC